MQPRFIVGVDFSAPSDAALATAMDYAKSFNAEVLLFHAVDYPGIQSGAPRRDLFEADAHKEAKQKLEAIKDRYVAEGIAVSFTIQNGDPCHRLGEFFEEVDGDLLFIGTHSNRDSDIPFLGSVTLAALRRCLKPIMIVHHSPRPHDGLLRALVPISRTYGIHSVIDSIAKCRWPFTVMIDLLHVVGPDENLETAQYFLDRKVIECQEAKIQTGNAQLAVGEDISNAVDEYMESTKMDYDLLLIENRSKVDLGALTLGGNLERIILNSKCPVLCVNIKPD